MNDFFIIKLKMTYFLSIRVQTRFLRLQQVCLSQRQVSSKLFDGKSSFIYLVESSPRDILGYQTLFWWNEKFQLILASFYFILYLLWQLDPQRSLYFKRRHTSNHEKKYSNNYNKKMSNKNNVINDYLDFWKNRYEFS